MSFVLISELKSLSRYFKGIFFISIDKMNHEKKGNFPLATFYETVVNSIIIFISS